MRLFNLITSILAIRLAEAYLVSPPGPAAPGASADCSEWVQQSYGLTCALIEDLFGIPEAQFQAWNPIVIELGTNCTLIPNLYYCVQINYSSISVASTSSASPSTITSIAASTTSTTFKTSTTISTSPPCTGLATVSPTPSGAVCNVQADSVALTGAGLLTAYTSVSPYVASVQACAAECIATSTCTNIYFVAGAKCHLHYGPTSYLVNNSGVNAYSLYDISCFVCATGTVAATTTSTGNVITTPSTNSVKIA